MKHSQFARGRNLERPVKTNSTTAAELNGNQVDFTPSAEEVSRRAYFAFVNQGSKPGHDVQHWLEAEKQLVQERRLARSHAFHNGV